MDRSILHRFFCGKASKEEIMQIKKWADSSPDNYKKLLEERKLFDTLLVSDKTEGKVFVPSFSTIHRVLPFKYISILKEFIKVAAIILLTVGITFTFLNKDDSLYTAMNTINVPAGQRVNITLPDGTDVWLNAGTKMSYPISFLSSKREVILDGEAYFDVAHNEKCPFVVHTYIRDIEVLGTQFNVEAYKNREIFQTSLIRGRVKIASSENDEEVILTPGHKASINQGSLNVEDIDYYDTFRWKEGLYCFRNKSFSEIMSDLEKYFDVSIEIQNDKIKDVTLTGKFRITEGFDYLLRVLQTDVSFSYSRDTDLNKIYIQ